MTWSITNLAQTREDPSRKLGKTAIARVGRVIVGGRKVSPGRTITLSDAVFAQFERRIRTYAACGLIRVAFIAPEAVRQVGDPEYAEERLAATLGVEDGPDVGEQADDVALMVGNLAGIENLQISDKLAAGIVGLAELGGIPDVKLTEPRPLGLYPPPVTSDLEPVADPDPAELPVVPRVAEPALAAELDDDDDGDIATPITPTKSRKARAPKEA